MRNAEVVRTVSKSFKKIAGHATLLFAVLLFDWTVPGFLAEEKKITRAEPENPGKQD